MAGITVDELLRDLTAACQKSSWVESYSVYASDEDTLGVRVFLTDTSLINAFYNVATEKIAFAWIQADKRLYGKDNTKMGWHVHPFDNPNNHVSCEPIDFATFLGEIEDLKNKQTRTYKRT